MRLPVSDSDDDMPFVATNARAAPNSTAAGVNGNKRRYSSDSGDDAPLLKRPKNGAVAAPSSLPASSQPIPNGRGARSPVLDSSDDDIPLSQPRAANGRATTVKGESSDDDLPLTTRTPRPPPVKRRIKEESDEDDGGGESSGDDDYASSPAKKPAPKAKAKVPAKPAKKRVKKEEEDGDAMDVDVKPKKKPAARKSKVKDEEEEEEDVKPKKAPRKSKAKKEEDSVSLPPSPSKKGRKAKAEEEEEEVFKWWELDVEGDGSQKWQTLVHSGVLFPPPYEALPSDVRLVYDGKPVKLPPESEEIAWFFGKILETEHAKDPVFQQNFFKDWQAILKKHPPADGTRITSFDKCDFRQMWDHHERQREAKKNLSAQEKKDAKEAKERTEAPFRTCLLDGRKEKVGNFRIEPPDLFRGRGEHPKKGSLKLRLRPEDITINIGEGVPVPEPTIPGRWAKVVHDNTVTWLATWKENVNGNTKYVFLAAGSSLKGQSDMQKFEKARELKKYVATIRADYERDLKSKIMADRQRATAMYFIDVLALRAGNEKGKDEADTVGCCSLRCEHITLERDTDGKEYVVFDFLGKDSIRYYNRVEVSSQVFKNIRLFKGDNKTDEDALFDRVSTTTLNKHLQSYMEGLTAKVFRTFNASSTFQRLLDEKDLTGASVAEMIASYTDANRQVAILCNHQRAAPKTHSATMEKLSEKLRAMKYERMKLRHALLTTEPKIKKSRPEMTEMESDIDDDWVAQYEDEQRKITLEKAEKKFVKDNEKLAAEDKEQNKPKILEERKEAINAEYDKLKKERGTGKATLKQAKTAEQLETLIEKQDNKIKTFKIQMNSREDTKTVALGTSKINYLDPRITVAWCKKWNVPIEKMFNKSLLTKFPWAMGADDEWKF